MAIIAADPHARVSVDVAARTIAVSGSDDTYTAPFALPDYARWRLLEGLDDIDVTLGHADAIANFERQRPDWLPSSRPPARASA